MEKNRYGYRHLVAEEDHAPAVARLTARAAQLQRTRKSDGAPFIPLQLGDLENQWNGLIDFTQGKHPQMTGEAARAAQEEVARVFRFRARAYMEEVASEDGRFRRQVRRVQFEDMQLPTCECTGGAEHYDLCADDCLDEVKAVMQQVVDATDAEEAHNAAWAVDALLTVLANHGINVSGWPLLWREVCPPLQRTVTREEAQRYQAWDGKWRVIGEDQVTGEVIIERDRTDLFHRAKQLLSEQAARMERRPYEPPAEWQPETKEGAEAPSGESEDVTAAAS